MSISLPGSKNPGVKVAEVQLVGPPISGVGTSTAGFVGTAIKNANHKDEARLVTSLDQFLRDYVAGAPTADDPMPIDPAQKSDALTQAVAGFFLNGGSACYVVNCATHTDGLKLLERVDDVAILAVPGSTDPDVYAALADQCERLGDRVAILDPPAGKVPINDLIKPVKPAPGGKRPVDSFWTAFYYPQIHIQSILKGDEDTLKAGKSIVAPPSGHIAGIYARVDSIRGVHKAPANEQVLGAVDVEDVLTDADQESLNPKGVNAIRFFSQGPVVFGARTTQVEGSEKKSEFKYISTRRLTSFIEESLQNGLRFAVFEPNNLALRQKIARSVRGFLDGVWRDGALFGATPDEAYYVRFPDLFNTDDDRAKGRLTIEVGIRPTFPAEFIIIRIGLLLQAANAS